MKRLIVSSAAAAGVGAMIASTGAAASGFMIREGSAESIGTVYSGDASRAESAATVFHNPAGMMRLEGNTLEAGTAVVFPSIKFNGSASVGGTPIPGNNGGNAGRTALIPHLYGVIDLGQDLKAGIAITSPFGSTAHYNSDWYGRYLENKTVAMAVDINPNLAFRVNDQLSIGAGFSAQYFRLDAAAAFPQFVFGPVPDGIYNFKADGWAWGYNFGVLLEPMPGTRVGASYRSELDHEIEGSLDFAGMLPALGTISGPARSDVTLPASATFSFTHDVNPMFSFSAEVQWTGWSSFDTLLIQSANPDFPNVQNYEDSWMFSVGGTWRVNDQWLLRGGAGFDQTPVTDEFRTVAVPDADRYMLGVGFGLKLNEQLSLDGGYAHYFAAEKPTMNRSANNTDPFVGVVVLNGRYTNSLDYVALTLRFTP